MKANVIEVRGVDFRYHQHTPWVMEDLSLEVPGGVITAVLGPNGTGKTSLLHIMLGLLQPSSGSVRIYGRDHRTYSRRELSQTISLVPQFEQIPFNFSVLEYVLLGRSPYLKPFQVPGEEDLEIANQSLRSAGIHSLRHQPVTELSGGERQLVHLSRALTQQAQILLLDEPTAHLDLENQGRVLRLLKDMASRGVTVVLTTHDPNAAIFAADHFVLMNGGRIVNEGDVSRVITAENLSAIYRSPIRVEQESGYPVVVLARED